MKVYFSHTGNNNLYSENEVNNIFNLKELADALNRTSGLEGIKNIIITGDKIASNVRVFKNIYVKDENKKGVVIRKYYEKDSTKEITSLSMLLEDADNLLISIFDPQLLLGMINDGMASEVKDSGFDYTDENGREKHANYKPMIGNIDFETNLLKEPIYEFKEGECTLDNLKIERNNDAEITFNGQNFNKAKSKLLPEDLVSAIADLWEISEEKGRLRLFQEDALFFIMSRLVNSNTTDGKQLLLSMPTGGGKTEAFMIPILSSIYQNKMKHDEKGVQAIVIYPTNALANDQAARFVEMIYGVNKKLFEKGISKRKQITIGIMTGDTPSNLSRLEAESLIKICPECGMNHLKKDGETLVCNNILEDGNLCGTSLDFCMLTKDSIIDNPPDILITNPDTINFALHSPKYNRIFKNKIKSIVFDEIHIYQGVFGCHIAHLLRRLEESIGHKPLYIGMSATIGNAKELAALLFDEPLENIKYIQNENNVYMNTNKVNKTRYHILVKPHLRKEIKNSFGQKEFKYVRTMSVAGCIGIFIGHVITDSHFRKSIIFTNYRSEADDLAGYLRERERLDGKLYFDTILGKIQKKQSLTREEVEICEYMDKWFQVIMKQTKQLNSNVEIGWNRGGLEKKERIRSIHSFSRNNLLADERGEAEEPIDIMVATKSLEVGIDIGDVTTAVNSSAPFTVNEYVQRVGRAGRKKDSLAITIVNPENAIDAYVMKHFNNYVYPEGTFEDAPIIVNNLIIIRKHVEARIVDYLISELYRQYPTIDSVFPTVEDIMKIEIPFEGKIAKLNKDVSTEDAIVFADAIYHNVFSQKVDGKCIELRFMDFINREAKILSTRKCELELSDFKEWIREIIQNISEKIVNKEIKLAQTFVGLSDSAFPNLTPSLRGSGATVALYLSGQDGGTPIDVVTRQTAYNQMPISSNNAITTTKSGISTFKIVDDKKESDSEAESIIRRKFKDNSVLEYFRTKFDDFPKGEDLFDVLSELNVYVLKNLSVSYFPSRFYCQHCQKGLIPGEDCTEKEDGVYCKCGRKAQQLHKVYMCQNDGCGRIYDPHVPKICLNPDCPSTKRAFDLYAKNNYSFANKRKEILGCFRFRLTKDLEWVCNECGNRINFSKWGAFQAGLNESAKKMLTINDWDKKTINGFCRHAVNIPEQAYYLDKEKAKETYKCDYRDHKTGRKPVGVPRVRTIAYNYIGNKKEGETDVVLCDEITTSAASIQFNEGYVLQLANEFMRRFSSGIGETESYSLKTERIFQKKYWANYYESHVAWVSLGKVLDKFIKNGIYSCNGDCAHCKRIEELDLGHMMQPKQYVEDYNYDAREQEPKKPDHRRKFCQYALEGICKEQCCINANGETCEHFNMDTFLRYIVVHTIKHGVLWALPKYAGVGVSEIKGEVYPNDNRETADFAMIDSNEGGSGAIILVQKHWNEIWTFAEDIIDSTTKNEANIILPHTCSRYNADICPFITKEFFNYYNSQE